MINDENREKVLLIVAAIIVMINMIGFFCEKYIDYRYGLIKDEYEDSIVNSLEDDEIEKLISDLKSGCKLLQNGIVVFASKEFIGILIVVLLALPQKFFENAKEEFYEHLIPDSSVTLVCELIIFVLLIYDIISPFSEISNYMALIDDTRCVLNDFLNDTNGVLNSIHFFDFQ